ncbi:MAG: DUF368 domain-containing protein [Candidatus Thermoplasmatota archaeon]
MTEEKQNLMDSLVVFLKGIFMGSADIIPGVSGGTIALITGIYERLIDAIRSIDLKFIPYFFKGFVDRKYFHKSKENFLGIDFVFLVSLALGVLVAFISLANVIDFLTDVYPSYTYAFFLGLIVSSAFVVYFSLEKNVGWTPLLWAVPGFLLAFYIVGLDAVNASHSILIVFVSGAASFCAMILPGVSGAFILLLLGQYTFMLNVLKKISGLDFSALPHASAYVLGGVFGLLVFSRGLSFLLKKYHAATLSFIIGLMIGSLRKPGGYIVSNPSNIFITFFSIAVGVVLVAALSHYSTRFDVADLS